MGKQSARMYFQGKEHSDVYFNGFNHSKIYRGNQLLWSRENPLFLIGGHNNIYTSETLKKFSEFRGDYGAMYFEDLIAPDIVDGSLRIDIPKVEFINSRYYALVRYRYSATSQNYDITFISSSSNGYDWKLLLRSDASEEYYYTIKKYCNKLAILTSKRLLLLSEDIDKVECTTVFLVDDIPIEGNILPDLQYEQYFRCMDILVGTDNTMLIPISFKNTGEKIALIKNGIYTGIIKLFNRYVPLMTGQYNTNDGYFYAVEGVAGNRFNIIRSENGSTWEKFGNEHEWEHLESSNYTQLFFHESYIYIVSTYPNESTYLLATTDGIAFTEKKLIQTGSSYDYYIAGKILQVDGKYYYCRKNEYMTIGDTSGLFEICKQDDLFDSNVQVTQYGITGHNHLSENIPHPFYCMACTDESIEVIF